MIRKQIYDAVYSLYFSALYSKWQHSHAFIANEYINAIVALSQHCPRDVRGMAVRRCCVVGFAPESQSKSRQPDLVWPMYGVHVRLYGGVRPPVVLVMNNNHRLLHFWLPGSYSGE